MTFCVPTLYYIENESLLGLLGTDIFFTLFFRTSQNLDASFYLAATRALNGTPKEIQDTDDIKFKIKKHLLDSRPLLFCSCYLGNRTNQRYLPMPSSKLTKLIFNKIQISSLTTIKPHIGFLVKIYEYSLPIIYKKQEWFVSKNKCQQFDQKSTQQLLCVFVTVNNLYFNGFR